MTGRETRCGRVDVGVGGGLVLKGKVASLGKSSNLTSDSCPHTTLRTPSPLPPHQTSPLNKPGPGDEEIALENIMALKYFRQLYSLDTLDTRFVVPATAPPKEALDEAKLDPAGSLPVPNGKRKTESRDEVVHPSRWNTPEFLFYIVIVTICVFFMIKSVVDVSKGPLCSRNATKTQS